MIREKRRCVHHAHAIDALHALHADAPADAVDPIEAIRHRRRDRRLTSKLPKTNATKASRAYYMQETCKGAGALKRLSQDDLFAPDGEVSPDLSDTRLILAWQETDKAISVTAYRPLEVVPYAYSGSARKYDFSLDLLDRPVEVKDFTPIEDNDDNLLPNLVFDDTNENESTEIQAER